MTTCNKCGSTNVHELIRDGNISFDGSGNDHLGASLHCGDCKARVIPEDVIPPANVIDLSFHRLLRKISKGWSD